MARGRKVNSSGEKSKKLLLEKAIELFSLYGYHKTKISDIVQAANLTQPTFYLYFQSKDKLFNDLNEEFSQKLLDILHNILTQTPENGQCKIKIANTMLNEIFTYFYENPYLTKIGFIESKNSNTLNDQMATIITETFLKNDHDKMKNSDQIEVMAHSMVGAIERLTLKYILPKEKTPECLSKEVIEIFFKEPLQSVNL